MNKCEKCDYWCIHTETCDYLLRTGERRGCPIDGCTRYKPVEKKKPKPLQLPTSPLLKKPKELTAKQLQQKKMRELYDAGKNDSEIAAIIGRTHQAVSQWRKTEGLPRLSYGRPRKDNHGQNFER